MWKFLLAASILKTFTLQNRYTTMGNLNFKGSIPVKDGVVETGLRLFSFIEDGVTIVYSPEMDINGSGYDLNQAKASFYEALSEFCRYGIAKGTFFNELKRMGWKISGGKKNKKITTPPFETMLDTNKEFQDIIHNKDYTKFTERMQIPA